MKKIIIMIAIGAILSACSKKEVNQESTDKWNGYENYYKAGEMYRDLVTRWGDVVGTVTYGIDDDANFYVKYETDGDWELVSTSMYAGKWKQMPRRHRNRSKVMSFPYRTYHSPYVSTYTYTIPLVDLPPAESPGFVVAAQARVYNTNKCGGGWHHYTYEEAWARWDRRFSCKSWGGYSNYFYNQPYEPHTLLYGTAYRNDSLVMYLVDATDGTTEMIASEYVGTPPSNSYDGTAFNNNTNEFFFSNYDLQELWVNRMDSTDSYKAGDLEGIAASATFYNDNYYYVDANTNEIKEVTFNGVSTDSLYIASENVISTVPGSVTVNDIAYESNGDYIYIVGVYEDNVQLIEYQVATDTYATVDLNIADNAQIAYSNDNTLYTVETDLEGNAIVSSLDPNSGTKSPIDENGVEVNDPFADLASGPIK